MNTRDLQIRFSVLSCRSQDGRERIRTNDSLAPQDTTLGINTNVRQTPSSSPPQDRYYSLRDNNRTHVAHCLGSVLCRPSPIRLRRSDSCLPIHSLICQYGVRQDMYRVRFINKSTGTYIMRQVHILIVRCTQNKRQVHKYSIRWQTHISRSR